MERFEWFGYFVFLLFYLAVAGKSPKRAIIKEIVIEAPQANAPVIPAVQTMPVTPLPADRTTPADPHAGLDMSAMGAALGMDSLMGNMFTWTAPEGWKQEAGGAMRLATFHLRSDAKAIDCSIVSLGGMAGGLEANLRLDQ